MPKEMLTIVDRPLIQIAVDEAREAGIEHFIFVTGRNKAIIEDHFDKQFELETNLRNRGKLEELVKLSVCLPAAGRTSFTRQQEPLGLGHAVWCARDIVGDEPFALILPDMVMHANPSCLKQMIDTYNITGGNVIAAEEVDENQTHHYGVLGANNWRGNSFNIDRMIEKPNQCTAPSNLIISGRYILQPEIFAEIETQSPGAGGEIQLTDAMIRMLGYQSFHGVKYQGKTYDCGDMVGFLLANIAFRLEHNVIGKDFQAALPMILTNYLKNSNDSSGLTSIQSSNLKDNLEINRTGT